MDVEVTEGHQDGVLHQPSLRLQEDLLGEGGGQEGPGEPGKLEGYDFILVFITISLTIVS